MLPAIISSMRLFLMFILAQAGALSASESVSAYPLWNGIETVAEYAKKVNVPPTQTLDLGNGVKLDLVLIPAGKFIMGTPVQEEPAVGQTMVGLSVGVLFMVMMTVL